MTPLRHAPKGSVKVRDKASDAEVFVYEVGDRFCAIAYSGKKTKPDWWLNFKTAERREQKVREHFAWRQACGARKAEHAAEKAAKRAKGHKLQVGHVLRSSWGYDQTNIDWFQVVELVGKCSVRVRPICGIDASKGNEPWMTGKTLPALDGFKEGSKATLHRVSTYDGASVRIDDVRSAYLWDGKAANWTAYA